MKVLFLVPHLSTGGMPAFLLKRIQALQKYTDVEIFVFEWMQYATAYVVQREQIIKLIDKDHFYSCGGIWEDRNKIQSNQKTIVEFCIKNKIDIIHLDESPEGFDHFNEFNEEIQNSLYDPSHPWRIIETPHGMWFDPKNNKKNHPDGYACVANEHAFNTYNFEFNHSTLIPFPIDPSIQNPKSKTQILQDRGWRTKGEFHIVNVGLWTQGKNQGYAIELAKMLWEKYKWTYIFHFIGNQADNFKSYWEPLMKDLPPNVKVYGERNDTSSFYKMVDAMLFTSTWECNPIVLKEAISNNLKILSYKLDHYGDEYDNFITPLTGNIIEDKEKILDTIHSPHLYNLGDYSLSVKEFATKNVLFYKLLLNEGTSRRKINS